MIYSLCTDYKTYGAGMSRVKFIEYNGKKIIMMDIDNCSIEEFEKILFDSAVMIRKENPDSVLSLVSGGQGTPIFTNKDMFMEYLRLNQPFIKASVVCGLPKMQAAMFQTVVAPTGRELKMFDTKSEAFDWLIAR